jgi:hypothetical protein
MFYFRILIIKKLRKNRIKSRAGRMRFAVRKVKVSSQGQARKSSKTFFI